MLGTKIMNLLEKFDKEQLKNLSRPAGRGSSTESGPELRPGDTIKVHQKIKEASPTGEKERIQIFEGIIIAKKHGKGISTTITVRKIVDGIGVERIFPIHSLSIDKIEVIMHGKTRRAKLYYLRTAKGKKAKLKRKDFATATANEPAEEPAADEAPVETIETANTEETPEE